MKDIIFKLRRLCQLANQKGAILSGVAGMKINNLNKERKMIIIKITELQGEKRNKIEVDKLEEIAKLRQIEELDKENRKWKRELEEALKEIDVLKQAVNIAEEGK